MKKVAVITRTKNRPILLERAFKSVNNQFFKDLVWVVINDGGEAEPVNKIVQKAKMSGIETKVIHNVTSLGMEAASNKAIKNCESSYVVIHDDDDSWLPEFLEKTVEFLDGPYGKIYDGVVTKSFKVEETLDESGYSIKNTVLYNDYLNSLFFSDIAKANMFPPISFIYKREVYNKIGGYNESLPVLGDWDFNLKFFLHGDIAVIPEPLANYHFRINNVPESYGNSVTYGMDKHKIYEVVLRNHLLREDIRNGKVGLGFLVNFERDFQGIMHLQTSGNLVSEIKRLIRQYGVFGLLKKMRKTKG